MKVGTDATILAVWADLHGVESILDVGSGSGIISLLLAARCNAHIHAVEIDTASVEESSENFRNSTFSHRLSVEKTGFVEYAASCDNRFDLIISNPPFFVNYNFKPKEESRKNARHIDTLDFQQLCSGVSKILKTTGKFCLVLPQAEQQNFLEIATRNQLHLQKQMHIFPIRKQAANRVNMQLGFENPGKIMTENYTIRENDLTFTAQHIQFLRNYYIGWDS
jgi:tRNA1Val (adenine37-N6)-methyltransferase